MVVDVGVRGKGVAKIRLANEKIRTAELHWYEAHGIGKKNLNVNAIWISK